MLTSKEQSILSALEPVAQLNNVEIVTIEVTGSKKAPTIRVYIDTENGVGFDELSAAQTWISECVEALDPFPGAYTLEVSSPGIDRPLRTPEHFSRCVGQEAVVKTTSAIDGRSQFSGTITSATEQLVILENQSRRIEIPFDHIKRAHIKGVIDFSDKK